MADEQSLKIQQQINEAIRQRGTLIQQQSRLLQEQLDIATELQKTMASSSLPEDGLEKLADLRDALREVGQETRTQQEMTQELAEQLAEGAAKADEGVAGWLGRAQKATKQTSLWAGAAAGFTDGLIFSFKTITKGLGGILSLATSVVGGIFSISKAILSIPFKIFNALVDEANRGGGGTELRQAYENVRKEFGNFREDVAKNVIGAARSMRGELSDTGLSVYRTAGRMYERLNLVAELAKDMGPDFHVFGTEIMQNAEAMVAYQKGLGLTGESMKALSSHTIVTGKTITQTFIDITKFSTAFGKKFGISSKLISRDIGEMQQDMKVFGNLGVKTMTQLSVYTRRLGISFKELQGIVDKFDNFEDAAENAAKLSQAFGVNVDVMKMMKEQDPGKRIDMMRKSFFASGKQIEKMTRQERAYLAATTGVEESALNQVFALKNQNIAYGDLEKTGDAVEKQQITQAEAMKKLSGAIERLVRSGQRMGGFWDRFLMGVRRGVRWSKDFRGTMRNIRRSLWVAERAGRQVGRAFAKAFPGMEQIIKGFREFFHPSKFRRLAKGVVSTFKQFFSDLSDPKKAGKALDNMLDNFKNTFGRMIKDENSALGKIVAGFKKAFKAVGQIILSAGKIIMQNLAKVFEAVGKWLTTDKMSFPEALKAAFGEGQSIVGDALSSIFDTIVKELGPAAGKMGNAFVFMMEAAWEKVKEFLKDFWKGKYTEGENPVVWAIKKYPKTAATIAGVMFGPAFIKAGMGALLQAVAKWAIVGKQSSVLKNAGSGWGGQFAKFFGDSATGELFPTFKRWFSSSKMTNVASTGGLNMGGGMVKGIGKGLLRGAGVVGAAIAAWEIGTQIGTQIDEAFKISDKLSGTGTAADPKRHEQEWNDVLQRSERFNDMNQRAIKQGLKHFDEAMDLTEGNREFAAITQKSAQEISTVLKEREDLSMQQRKVLLKALKTEVDYETTKRMRDAFKKIEDQVAMGDIDEDAARAMKKKAAENIKKQLSEAGIVMTKAMEEEHKELMQKSAEQFHDRAKQSQAAAAAEARLRAKVQFGKTDVTDTDLSTFEKIKDLKPDKVKKVLADFNKPGGVKELLIGPDGKGGLRQTMIEIGKAFSGGEIGDAMVVVEAMKQFGGINKGLSALADVAKIDTKALGAANINLGAASATLMELQKIGKQGVGDALLMIGAFNEMAALEPALKSFANLSKLDHNKIFEAGANVVDAANAMGDPSLVNAAKLVKDNAAVFTGAADSMSSVMDFAKGVRPVMRELNKLGKAKMPAGDFPAVKVIKDMVSTVKTIDSDLSGIHTANLKPKLTSLGKHLGLGGSDTFTINNKNFKIEVNMQVIMETDEVADVLLETGKFVKSPSNTKG